jgi:hypothetical protein
LNEAVWFFAGLFLGLALDFLLVLHMLSPIKRRISELESKQKS